jgi:3-oxoadipate enol-lactonase
MIVRANGIDLNAELSGQKNGETVILIHGIGADLRLWADVVPYFEKKFQVLAYDLRGAGKSEFPSSPPLSVELWAADLDSLTSELGIENAHLIGWSLGGMISTEFYLKSPKKVRSLVHVGSTPKLQPAAAQLFRERAMLAEEQGMKVLIEKTFQMTEASFAPSVRAQHPEKVAKFRAMLENHNKDGYAAIARGLVEADLTAHLSEILTPTMIIVGDYDSRTPLQDAELMSKKIPDSYMKIIPECGHFYPLEQPEEFSKVAMRFLDRLS